MPGGVPTTWRLIKSSSADAFTNMAVDEAILKTVGGGNSPPTVRFYSWEPPAVSVGYFQDALRDVDLAACREMGIDVVRRLTGGRAVLHERDLTYSVICPLDATFFPDNILAAYRIISSCLVKGLNRLGLDASLTPPARRRKGGESPAACFSSASRYEITISGKKLIGSAQKRCDGAFLQHGSVLTEFQKERFEKVFPKKGGLHRIASIGEYMSADIAMLVECLKKGFEDGLGVRFNEGTLTPQETALAQKLIEDRYSCRGWNFGRNAQGA